MTNDWNVLTVFRRRDYKTGEPYVVHSLKLKLNVLVQSTMEDAIGSYLNRKMNEFS